MLNQHLQVLVNRTFVLRSIGKPDPQLLKIRVSKLHFQLLQFFWFRGMGGGYK